jgi:hypothetical protein
LLLTKLLTQSWYITILLNNNISSASKLQNCKIATAVKLLLLQNTTFKKLAAATKLPNYNFVTVPKWTQFQICYCCKFYSYKIALTKNFTQRCCIYDILLPVCKYRRNRFDTPPGEIHIQVNTIKNRKYIYFF